jgi:spore coat polysaccharide biosynthesis protein SpsF (cytidylyltransferase family)/sialic acid synthase SpsE
MKPYHIIEVANTHAGNFEYISELINDFKDFEGNFGIKFQPLKPELIALPDFSFYPIYEEIYFNEIEWNKIIIEANRTKNVWLDMFDLYSVEILNQNIDYIKGLKLQASVLFNQELIQALSNVNLENKLLIINIAGYNINEIKSIITDIKNSINVYEIIIQFGFQNYPTDFSDSGLSKIRVLKEEFKGHKLCFADHLDGNSEDALLMPLVAFILGAEYIEKHVCLSSRETKYDKFSSIDFKKYTHLIQLFDKYTSALNQEFINNREYAYLNKSLQIPVLNKTLPQGSIINYNNDISFKRTDKKGLNALELKQLLSNKYILTKEKKSGEVLHFEDFKKATIGSIVACRMKSSRLPQKAILKIGNLTSIELCLKNVLKFKNINHTILATSILEEDKILENYTYNDTVIFHQGDPEDVIQRFLDIIDRLKIDIIIRLTGDCPYLSKDVCDIILDSHFETGADYTSSINACIGLNIEVFNTSTLKKIKSFFPYADYSEYMTYYVINNPSHFKINLVKLPTTMVRDYRITLDYEEDLELFNIIQKHFDENFIDYSIFELFKFLDTNPEIAKINKGGEVKYKTDKVLIDKIQKATTIG